MKKNTPISPAAGRLLIAALVLALASAHSAEAQPADSCSVGDPQVPPGQIDNYPGMPVVGPSDAINLATCLGSDGGNDAVLCFTPASSDCTPQITCTGEGPLTLGMTTGPCSDSPSAVCNPTSGAVNSASISPTGLTGGTEYCVYCQKDAPGGAASLNIAITSTNCGTLPVGLLDFSVE